MIIIVLINTALYECADRHIISADIFFFFFFFYECADFLLSNARFKKRGFNEF